MGAVQSMSEAELRWLIAGVGLIILILIWLWSSRKPLRRQEHDASAPTLTSASTPQTDREAPDSDKSEHHFGEFGSITPDHHLADRALVDVEIIPLKRSGASLPEEQAAGTQAPAPTDEADEEATAGEETPAQHPHETTGDTASELAALGESPGGQPELAIVLTVTAPPARPFRGPSILLAAQELKLKLHKSGVFDYFHPDQLKSKPVFSIGQLREPGTFDLDNIGKLTTPGLLLYMHLPGVAAPLEAVDLLIQIARELAQKLGGTVCDERRERMTGQAYIKLRSDAAELEKQLGSR